MDKHAVLGEVLRVYEDRDRWKGIADRVTAERNSAWSRLMSLTGTNRASDVPEGEELLAGRLMRYARRELYKRCVRIRQTKDDATFEEFADDCIDTWNVPDELSKDDVKTILDSEIRKLYEDVTREGNCDE